LSAVSKATIDTLGAGRFRLAGVLDAKSVIDLFKEGPARFKGLSDVEIDLADVAESDSAGLALLIEWLRAARRNGQQIRFVNIPAQIAALARISEVDALLEGAQSPA
jgi:phospholipid transport system transporter-binding protein